MLATDVDAELGFITLCVESDRPDGPRQSGVAQGLSLIPFSVVGVVVDEIKTGWNAENSRTPRSDMVRGWDDFGDTHKESLEYLEPMQVPWNELCDVQHATRKMCACVRTVRCYLFTSPSRSRHLPVSGRGNLVEKKYMADECAKPQIKIEDFGNN